MNLVPQVKPHLRGWFHVVAFVAATALCPIVIVYSPGARAPAAIYTAAIIGVFGVSAGYHRFRWGPTMNEVLKRLDHTMIFVSIAATYTPIAVVALPDGPGTLILRVVWIAAAAGVVTQLLWPHAPRPVTVSLYLAVGWAALIVIDDIWRSLGVAGFLLLMIGGLMHTVAALVYALKRPDPWPRWLGYHEIFHLVGTAAIATHYVAVAVIALPKGMG